MSLSEFLCVVGAAMAMYLLGVVVGISAEQSYQINHHAEVSCSHN